MRIRRHARLAPWALLLVAAAWTPARGADADGGGAEALTIATEWVRLDAPAKAGDPPRADRAPEPVDLSEARPASVRAAPLAAGSVRYGELPIGGTKVAVATVRGTGDALTVYLDANGDGSFADGSESNVAKCDPVLDTSKGGGRKTTWKVAEVRVGEARLALAAEERPYAIAGWLRLPPREDQKPLGDVRLDFTPTKPGTVAKAPELAGSILYASAVVEGRPVVIAVARGTGDALTVVVDANGDNDLTPAGERQSPAGEPVEGRATKGTRRIGTSWATAQRLTVLGHPASVQLSEIPADLSLTVNVAGSRRGQTTVAGKPYTLLLLDADLDGRVSSEDDLWWFGPADWFGVQHRPRWATMFEATELMRGWGAWRLQSVAADGAAIVVRAEEPPDPEAYLRRREERVYEKRWRSIFEEEEKALPAGRPHRPRAAALPSWRYATDLDAARAIAAKEGKPLLVDFEADWCKPCHRLDHFVYSDREVQEWLSKFTAVKFNVELDPKETLWKFTGPDGKPWGGLPAIAVFKSSGGPPVRFSVAGPAGSNAPKIEVDHMSRVLEPQDLVAGLRAAYDASATDK